MFYDLFSYKSPSVNIGPLAGTYGDLELQKLWRFFFSYVLEGLFLIPLEGLFLIPCSRLPLLENASILRKHEAFFQSGTAHLCEMIDRDYDSLEEEHRIVTWHGGVVVSAV